jgi:SAM-dependent methyltransferase
MNRVNERVDSFSAEGMPESPFAEPRIVSNPDECLFYHTVDMPGWGTVKGFWDLRGSEAEYLGNVDFNGRRVLEIGPASGHLTFFMERHGAEVVSVEARDETVWDLFWDLYEPLPAHLQTLRTDSCKALNEIKNSYWFCHDAFNSKARVHYGSAYELPAELGQFDVSVMACMLLHNKNPLRIIENCARLTRDEIIIVEPVRKLQSAQAAAEFLPTGDEPWWDTWWGFTPRFFVNVLRSMGFTHSTVTHHTQICFDKPQELFTVVARREQPNEEPAASAINVKLESPVQALRLRVNSVVDLPLKVTNLGEQPLSSFSTPPLLISYHWKHNSGEIAVWDGLRTELPYALSSGEVEDMFVSVQAPAEPSDYVLEITLVQETVQWYDDAIAGLPVRVQATVTA